MYNYHTVSKKILGDLNTPVSVYLRVRDAYPQSALMECSDYHDGKNSRSFICLHPIGSVSVEHGVGVMKFPNGEETHTPITNADDTAQLINEFLGNFNIEGTNKIDCGIFGYTTFNAVRYFEHIDVKDETQAENDAPDLLYILYKDYIIFDHFKNEVTLIELLADGEEDDLDQLEHDVNNRPYQQYGFHPVGDYTSTLTDDEHRENIRRGIKHCLRGDVFQIVLSRRFKQKYEGDDFKLYRALRSINPSPYLFYMDFGGFRIFGSSPETHCRIEAVSSSSPTGATPSFRAYIDPIAGTTKRIGDEEQDRQNALYLKNDPKENAEHVMLVDLARNDISRNCHDVKVDFYKDMQFYSHVIHLVSRVSGTLNEGADPVKAFIDTFPAGTLSGAPKVRAMQLISEYEPHNRGAYGGCVGSIGFDGSLNQAITIRTFVSRNSELWFQAGGGIVAKSDVEYELQEVNNKLGALRKAIAIAEKL
ncbi:MAG: anthranilate synthase component I family protein [Bacteroidaceae bacterium]|nr:anthranilate synthase component I family protein [Bacteroidaceae bacterium]MBQ7460737.1 anthranilate synthase component I family protein [Bacteroidaceae bacterium]